MHNLKDLRKNLEFFKKKFNERNLNFDEKKFDKLDKINRDFINKKEQLEQEKKILSKSKDKTNFEKSFKLYEDLKKKNIDVLLDDVDEGMANKFKKHDLLGIPYQIIIGSKTTGDNFEFKEVDKDSKVMNLGQILQTLRN